MSEQNPMLNLDERVQLMFEHLSSTRDPRAKFLMGLYQRNLRESADFFEAAQTASGAVLAAVQEREFHDLYGFLQCGSAGNLYLDLRNRIKNAHVAIEQREIEPFHYKTWPQPVFWMGFGENVIEETHPPSDEPIKRLEPIVFEYPGIGNQFQVSYPKDGETGIIYTEKHLYRYLGQNLDALRRSSFRYFLELIFSLEDLPGAFQVGRESAEASKNPNSPDYQILFDRFDYLLNAKLRRDGIVINLRREFGGRILDPAMGEYQVAISTLTQIKDYLFQDLKLAGTALVKVAPK